MTGALLLTGATGFLGTELLSRQLERTDRPIIAPVRASSDYAARQRIDALLHNMFGVRGQRHASRIEAVAADLSAPGLGLSATRRRELARRATTILHCAASVSFSLPLAEARAINLEGTRGMLELAGQCPELDCYGHVSTAYVAGTHAGTFGEGDLEVGQDFRNTYEQTKYEAEQLVREQTGLPYKVLRPSIVVGDRRSGWTAAFNVLYWPLRAFARGLFTAVPAVPSSPVDAVSVDYVADAIDELCRSRHAAGTTYHLTAGRDASTIGEVALLASRYFRRPVPRVVPPGEFEDDRLKDGSAYFPYFSLATVFDEAATRARLEPAGISVSPLREYIERLLDFATLSRWGKRPITRSEASTPPPTRGVVGL
jgi:thioester reductase-like protein